VAKRTVSFGDYKEPEYEEYTGEDPPANRWFNAACTRARWDAESESIVFIFEISEGDFKGWGKSWYAPVEGDRKWKAQEAIRALQGGITKDLTLDWENERAVELWLKKAKPVRIRTREWNDNIQVGKVRPLLESVGGGSKPSTPAPDPVEDDEAPVEDYTAEELSEMSVEDLEEVLTEEFEFSEEDLPEKGKGRGAAAKYKKDLIEAVLAEQEEGDDEDGDEDGEFEDGFEQEDGAEEEPEPEPEPEPAPRARRSRATKAAPAKAALATRRRRG